MKLPPFLVLMILAVSHSACGVHSGAVALKSPYCTSAPAVGGATITCPDGSTTFIADGTAGVNGHSALIVQLTGPHSTLTKACTLIVAGTDSNDNGILEVAETTVSAELCDGSPAPAFTPVSIINFCSPVQNWSEVGIRIGDAIVASMSANDAGDLTHFTVIIPGAYRTTDGYSCNFTITSDGSVVH
jgi:hypothetical protein